MANLKKITILFLLIVLSSFVYSATENTAFGKFVNNGEYTITKTGNEANYDVSLETKEVDISSTWIKILSFLKLDERDYEEQIAVQICTGNLTNKEFKFKEASNGFDVINKKTKETKYFIYNELPKKDISGKVLKTISKELKENIKDSIKTGERYCYYDMIPKNITYVKYGDNSIVITPNYDFSTDVLENQTRAEPNNLHLEINDTANKYAVFDGNGDYVSVGQMTELDVSSNFTISVWVRKLGEPNLAFPAILDRSQGDMTSGGNPGLGFILFDVTDNWRFKISDDTTNSNDELVLIDSTDSNWHNFIIIGNETNLSAYVDGSFDSSIPRVNSLGD